MGVRYGIGGQKITQAELRERVNYDPDSGIMTLKRKPRKGGHTPIGGVMGSKHKAGYLEVRLNNRAYLIHRLAWLYMYGEWPDNVDHINHDRTDNRLINLRSVARVDNQRNQKMKSNNSSGVTGVYWMAGRGKWLSKIKVAYKETNLGYHGNFFDAVCARKSAELLYGFHANHGRTV